MEKQKTYAQIGVRVSDELLRQLTEFAQKEQRSMGQVVRMALEQYMAPKGHSL